MCEILLFNIDAIYAGNVENNFGKNKQLLRARLIWRGKRGKMENPL